LEVILMDTREGPADTRMMGIVHDALKRDLRRARQVLLASPAPQGRQCVGLGKHVRWMLDFLHAHHSGEDAGLGPLVRRRNPAAGELLDSLEAEHARIAAAADAVAAAAREYTSTTGDWLLESVDAEGYEVVVHKVPVVLRFILLHGFARASRRQADARWTSGKSPFTAAAS
jgi:hypothetical protein